MDWTKSIRYDAHGRAVAGMTDDGVPFTIRYGADGESVERFADGSWLESNAAGQPVAQHTPDGTVFNRFDVHGRPVVGVTPDGRWFTISYAADGGRVEHFTDGSWLNSDAAGHVTAEHTAEGTDFTRFDSQSRPVAGTTADGKSFTIAYDNHGDAIERFADKSWVRSDASGHVTAEHTVGGTTFTRFDSQSRPVAGTTADGKSFTITYDNHGNTTERFTDKSWVRSDASGHVTAQHTANGTNYTKFDSKNRPVAGTDADGTPFTVSYDGKGNATSTSAGGTVTTPVGGGSGTTGATGTTGTTGATGTTGTTTTTEGGSSAEGPSGSGGQTSGVQAFKVDLRQLRDAADLVRRQHSHIDEQIERIRSTFTTIHHNWQSLAGDQFSYLTTEFNTSMATLNDLLDQMATKLDAAYWNYREVEEKNERMYHAT